MSAELTDLRDEVAGVLAAHRLMFWAVDHVWGNEPESSRTAPRCSCGVLRSGGGYESVASQVAWWEAHVSRALLPLIAQREAAARAEALRQAADALIPFPSNDYGAFPWGAQSWLRDRAALTEESDRG